MIAVSRDAAWIARLRAAAARGGWELVAVGEDSVPEDRGAPARALLVIDRAAVRGPLGRAIAGLRSRFPAARIALCFSESEFGADGVTSGLVSGADEVIVKSWADDRLFARLSALRDAVLAAAVRLSGDGALKAEKRSRRVFHLRRGRWEDVNVAAAEFALLWMLLSAEGEAVPRERLLGALREAAGREVGAETVSRRVLSLRRALAPWKGRIVSVRGGFYRLVSSAARRRSMT
jgi:hypothetical protein